MKKRRVIFNADDCNLSAGVTRGILESHDLGVVSSTTFMINLPISLLTIRELKLHPRLGVGLHLNITLGRPAADTARVESLLDHAGNFRKIRKEDPVVTRKVKEVMVEYEAQFRQFKKVFGHKPTHVDTHHQIHDDPSIYKMLCEFARKNKVPMRRSGRSPKKSPGLPRTTDYLWGNLSIHRYWRRNKIRQLLHDLPTGLHEIMCHPGYVDPALRRLSSFTTGRAEERKLLGSRSMRTYLDELGIELTHYGLCYT